MEGTYYWISRSARTRHSLRTSWNRVGHDCADGHFECHERCELVQQCGFGVPCSVYHKISAFALIVNP
jgi:hypothetical protein